MYIYNQFNNYIKNLIDILVYKVIYLPWLKKIYRLEKKEEEDGECNDPF